MDGTKNGFPQEVIDEVNAWTAGEAERIKAEQDARAIEAYKRASQIVTEAIRNGDWAIPVRVLSDALEITVVTAKCACMTPIG